MQKLKIGYFEHWHQPPYKFVEFLKEQGIEIEKIDYSQPKYLDKFDVALIEQNGFNDYIENDEEYIQNWVKQGGIIWFMHQDYRRWAPYFLPGDVGYTQLIHRHIPTINGKSCAADPTFTDDDSLYMVYMMPWIEDCGKRLFSEPETITSDEMLDWNVSAGSFGIHNDTNVNNSKILRTVAESCFLLPDNWDIIGSYMDSAVNNGSLIAKANYGKGMYFVNQLLFPEIKNEVAERSLSFWKKYVKNLLAYFGRFINGESEDMPTVKKELPVKKNYKLAIHMHSLDWYGADSAPGTINATMRYMNWDICALAVKDNAPYKGKLNVEKYSDDKVLFLDGQEYHPFNWNDKYEHLSHNTYHMLAMGIDSDAYTTEFTRSLFSDDEVAAYLKKCVDYVHEKNGAICATHPDVDYWDIYDVDAVDKEPLAPLSGTDIERNWLNGKRFAIMNSVDFFGTRRAYDNPAANFIYLKGEKPTRESVVKAVRNHHTIASTGFDEADITLGNYLPGDEVSKAEAENGTIKIHAKVMKNTIKQVRVYSADKLIFTKDFDENEISLDVSLKGLKLDKFVRVEIEGLNKHWICNSTPFFLK